MGCGRNEGSAPWDAMGSELWDAVGMRDQPRGKLRLCCRHSHACSGTQKHPNTPGKFQTTFPRGDPAWNSKEGAVRVTIRSRLDLQPVPAPSIPASLPLPPVTSCPWDIPPGNSSGFPEKQLRSWRVFPPPGCAQDSQPVTSVLHVASVSSGATPASPALPC